ncbi:GNAT family N-acetyltransferase [Amycolatopsis antarctica]|uniref:GNAT family N-acetyltransferase n=1 Tax=Amycolatopsis antarctica TaxID=1854586 RepID=A0A263DC80_9PSEU|nr:GNAT family N-acetyltransferase [Amycolatopsis antarctica]OZM75106.1 GNAT family N-acetyltransferase [Amycolatopsis antarctica]
MNATERLEHACADVWPAVTENTIGEWRLRAAGGFTGRANSALAAGDPGRPIGQALTEVRRFAAEHGIPPKLQVVLDSPVEAGLRAWGWVPDTGHPHGHDVAVLTGPVGGRAGGQDVGADVRVPDEPTAGWWTLSVGSATPDAAQRHVLTHGGRIGYGVAERAGNAAGAVRGALAGDLLHVSRLAVAPAHRRQGLAAALMAGLGTWAARHGATRCVLQVARGNHPALALYQRLGFAEHHGYRYWVPGPAACSGSRQPAGSRAPGALRGAAGTCKDPFP